MSAVLEFAGPVQVQFDSARPLALTLSGLQRGTRDIHLLVCMAVQRDPRLPSTFTDLEIVGPQGHDWEAPRAEPRRFQLQSIGQEHAVDAHRVVVFRDLEARMRAVVPPQPVGLGYRLRWHLGIWLARLPGIRARTKD